MHPQKRRHSCENPAFDKKFQTPRDVSEVTVKRHSKSKRRRGRFSGQPQIVVFCVFICAKQSRKELWVIFFRCRKGKNIVANIARIAYRIFRKQIYKENACSLVCKAVQRFTQKPKWSGQSSCLSIFSLLLRVCVFFFRDGAAETIRIHLICGAILSNNSIRFKDFASFFAIIQDWLDRATSVPVTCKAYIRRKSYAARKCRFDCGKTENSCLG